MGLLSIFARKTDDIEQLALDFDAAEKDEEEAEAEEERDVASERQLYGQVGLVLGQKVTIVQAQGAYFKAAAVTVNAAKTLTTGFANLFKKAKAAALQAAVGAVDSASQAFGGRVDTFAGGYVMVQQINNEASLLNAKLQLRKAQNAPIFNMSIRKKKLIENENELLDTMKALLSREKRDINREVKDAERIAEDFEKELVDLENEKKELKDKYDKVTGRIK